MTVAAIPLDMVENSDLTIARRKAIDFVEEIKRVFDESHKDAVGVASHYPGSGAVGVLDHLFKMLGETGNDFGYMVSFQSEETPAIDDIFFGASWDVYRNMVDRYSEFDREMDFYMTRPEAFSAFASLVAKFVLGSYPVHAPVAQAKDHVVRAVCSMFDGSNPDGVEFTLRYTETAPIGEGEQIDCTVPLGPYLVPKHLAF